MNGDYLKNSRNWSIGESCQLLRTFYAVQFILKTDALSFPNPEPVRVLEGEGIPVSWKGGAIDGQVVRR